ncbi:YidH family protein [Streptomyces sp. NPDC052042]|uniref:YidH family protein n=1 Tax=Streptomyces sp. NPDC052042 TaxID=3365683 RepID=UPI0037CD8707
MSFPWSTAPRTGRSAPWYEEGEEPDYRFSLANERTFLAWFRTGLALIAGALAVAQFIQPHTRGTVGTALGALLAVTGALLCTAAYWRWRTVQRAMRHKQPLPPTRMLSALALGASLTGLGLLFLIAKGP